MITVNLDEKKIRVPESVDELNQAQYLRLLDLNFLFLNESTPSFIAQLKVLSVLLDLDADLSVYPSWFQNEALQFIGLAEPFLREDGAGLDLFTSRNLLPSYRGFIGPGDLLDGTDFGTFCDAMSLMRTFRDGDDEQHMWAMQKMGELFYRNGKGEQPPAEVCYHACLLFMNVFRVLTTEPVNLNGEDLDFRILFESSGRKKADDRSGWAGVAMDVAESGVFGTYQQVRETSMWDVLLFLYRKKFQSDHEKRREK